VKVISRERLKELIEKEEPIYVVKYGDYEKKQINKHITHDFYDDCIMWWGYLPRKEWKYEHCFETEEEAKWYCEFGCIERTERLELPTWEEAENINKYIICEFDWYRLLMCPADNIGDTGWIGIDSGGNCELYHWDNANKENYLKACQKCKELFLGGSDGDIR
jgi:hypothetical protein